MREVTAGCDSNGALRDMTRAMCDFRSDNTHGASPEILEAVARASAGTMTSYGEDAITERVRSRCREIFETEVEIFPVVSGTAGNALAIAAMTPPAGAVLCHEDAHIHRDERGAPEFFTGGAQVVPIAGADGKLDPASLNGPGTASCLSLTNATEAGTVYRPEEMRALGDVARRRGLGVHLDGARFANALVSLGCAPADLTWRAGVDVLVLGATKNGALAAELLVVFRRELASAIAPRCHRAGHRISKMRFLSAQLEAYLTDDLWLRNARHANAMAARFAAAVRGRVEILRSVEANLVFVRLPAPPDGAEMYDWPLVGDGAYRLAFGFGTTEAEVDALAARYR